MFRGQFIHKISQTGRVSIPSKFRDNLKLKHKTSSLILSSFENSLICYPLPEWEKLESKISSLPQFKKDTVEFERYLIGNAHESEIDNEGRIMIPSILRKHFKISNSAVFVGCSYDLRFGQKRVGAKTLLLVLKNFKKVER